MSSIEGKLHDARMTLPHALKRIHLQLVRPKEFFSGSSRHDYELVAPLDRNGRIDPHLWHEYKDHCLVRHFWDGEEDEVGRLVHKQAEPEHARWVFDFDPGSNDDAAEYRFGAQSFAPGEYVSIRDGYGVTHRLQIISVQPAA